MSRLSFAEALAEDDKKQQAQQTQTTTPAQQQVVAGQIGGGSTTSQATTVPGIKPQPAYKDIKDKTKANEANKQIAQTAAGNNSDEPSPIDMGTGTRRFNHGSNETPRTPEEQAKIDAHDREVEQMGYSDPSDDTEDSPIDGYGTSGTYSGYGAYENPGYGAYGYPGYGYGYPDVQTLDDVTNALMPYHVPNSEELKKEQKRERRDMLIRSLGDGISAIAGLTTAINGGPNIVNPDASLAKSGREMYDKLREQRRKDYTAYLNAALKREQASAATLRARTNLERSREISRREAMKAEHAIKIAEQKMQLAKDKQAADEAYHDALAAIQKERLRIQEEYNQGRLSLAEKNLAIKQLKATEDRLKSGGRSSSGGRRGGSSGGGSSKDYETETWSTYEDDRGEVKHSRKVYGGSGSSKPSSGKPASGGGKKGKSAVSEVIKKHK